MKTIYLAFIVFSINFLSVPYICYGQDELNAPKEILPSPQVQQFEKYGNFPPGAFNGIPKISIPLYTVTEGDLTIPITLNYYAEGAKLTATNGFVGMGWTIMAGGKISRTIVDQPDDEADAPTTFYTASQLNAMTIYNRDQILDNWKVNGPVYDTEPDMFSYNFNGHAGKFVLQRDAAKTPMLLPYKPISIMPVLSGNIGAFNATDEKGIKYVFSAAELNNSRGGSGFMAWDCSSMTTPAGRQVTFQYQAGPYETFNDAVSYGYVIQDTEMSTVGFNSNCGFDGFDDVLPNYSPGFTDRYDVQQYGPSQPYKITFSGGTVTFVEDPSTSLLKEIQIADVNGKLLKVIGFVIAPELSYRYILKEVDFYDGQRSLVNNYKMNYYNENTDLPMPGSDGNIDYWGYYNGGLSIYQNYLPPWTIYQNPSTFPALTVGNDYNRLPSLGFAETYMLSTLTYPTGGYTTYQYELNQINYTAPYYYGSSQIGGLRINTIANYAAPGAVPETHTYQYDGDQVDFFPGNPDDYSYSYQGIIPSWQGPVGPNGINFGGDWAPFRERWYNSEPSYNMTPHGSPEVYTHVTEYIGDGTTNSGKTDYIFDYTAPATTTYPTNGTYDLEGNSILYKKYLMPFQDWTSGTLLSKQYSKNVSGSYVGVYEEDYTYTDYPRDTLRGMKLDRYVNWFQDGCSTSDTNAGYTWYDDEYLTMFGGVDAWNYGDYYITSGDRRLTSTSIVKDGVEHTTNYVYGDVVRDQPTQETINSSTGDNFITQLSYPANFAGTNPTYATMDANHIWDLPVEKLTYKKNTGNFLSSELFSYDTQGKTLSVATKKANIANAYDTRLQYNAYSLDKPSDVSKPGGPRTSYQWGYSNRYPVAECINAPVNDMFYDSFEEGDGNTADAKTGHYGHNGYYSHALTGLDISGSYMLTYWQGSGTSWTLQSSIVNVTAPDFTIGISPPLGQDIDDVRFYPVNAQMTTYTYDLLVGLTSSTDAKGEITYYEYDNFQRLVNIKDKDGNITKHMNYHYQGH